jgi:hypothetical protein
MASITLKLKEEEEGKRKKVGRKEIGRLEIGK